MALVVNSPYFRKGWSPWQRDDFVDRVSKAGDFDDLSEKDKKIVLLAEKSIKDNL